VQRANKTMNTAARLSSAVGTAMAPAVALKKRGVRSAGYPLSTVRLQMATDDLLQHLRARKSRCINRTFAVIRFDLTSCYMSRLRNSAVRDVATAGLIFWNSCRLKCHRDRSGPKTSQ
jgi:hypothetical protein